ncbi:MAG: hypothetical protein HY903_21080 [Deltaproteobacteria bacterium]|nr:hypothetical protein [Deltaproteobacteria bacterium]
MIAVVALAGSPPFVAPRPARLPALVAEAREPSAPRPEAPEWQEVAPPVEADTHAAFEPLVSSPRGLTAGLRLDSDWIAVKDGVGSAPVIAANWSGREVGVATALTITRPIGWRLEGRLYPWPRGGVRPFAGLGAALFWPDVAVRAVAGGEWKPWGPVVVQLDVAFERFVRTSPAFRSSALVVGVGVGYNFLNF